MPTGAVLSGQVNSPDDVLKALNKVIDYYQRSELQAPFLSCLNVQRVGFQRDFLTSWGIWLQMG